MFTSTNGASQSTNGRNTLDKFLVCGLKSLGQHCVAVLKEYDVSVIAIDSEQPEHWEVPEIPNILEKLIIGDCRQPSILEAADIHQCRSVIFVTRNERMNIEAAFAARRLNPQIRLIVRSDKQNLNELLGENLGNFFAFEPTQLSAYAFALTALSSETIGYFNLEGQLFQVIQHQVKRDEEWCYRSILYTLNNQTRRILSHTRFSATLPKQFHDWEPEAIVKAGDTLIYIDIVQQLETSKEVAELAYGYGVVPILHQNLQNNYSLMPNYETRLDVGDRLIVLATSDALQRIEWGEMLPRLWQVHIEQALTRNAIIDGTGIIASITGCNLSTAKDIMNDLPATLSTQLYQHQAQYLVRELSKVKVLSSLINIKQTVN